MFLLWPAFCEPGWCSVYGGEPPKSARSRPQAFKDGFSRFDETSPAKRLFWGAQGAPGSGGSEASKGTFCKVHEAPELHPARQSIMHDRGCDHVDSCDRCTSMKIVLDCVVGLTSNVKVTHFTSCSCRDERPMRPSAKCAIGTIPFLRSTQLSAQPRTATGIGWGVIATAVRYVARSASGSAPPIRDGAAAGERGARYAAVAAWKLEDWTGTHGSRKTL